MVALKTFNNLPETRRDEIITACLEEFALHEYETASLSTIVTSLKLAKGSFYRYFESKQALYLFLLDHCTDVRLKNDEKYINNSTSDFFELLAQHFAAKIQFDKRFPLHSAFLYNVMQEKNNDELGNIQLTSKLKVLEIIKHLVATQTKKKVLRSDLDNDTISFMILHTQLLIIDYIAITYKIDFRENIRHKKPLYSLPEKELLRISRYFIEILKNGIINKQKK
jgi:TetR/AcrR family transcriptional regulator